MESLIDLRLNRSHCCVECVVIFSSILNIYINFTLVLIKFRAIFTQNQCLLKFKFNLKNIFWLNYK